MAKNRKSISRSLGEFFGHIAHGVKGDLSSDQPERREVRREVEEREGEVDGRRVTLRRTTIEEIEIDEGSSADTDDERGR
jgi:hypothetical protein